MVTCPFVCVQAGEQAWFVLNFAKSDVEKMFTKLTAAELRNGSGLFPGLFNGLWKLESLACIAFSLSLIQNE